MALICSTAQHSTAQQSTPKLTPFIIALLASLPLLIQPLAIASEPAQNLPDIGAAPTPSTATFRPGSGGLAFENTFDGKKIVVTPEHSKQTGLGLSAALAAMFGDRAAAGLLLTSGRDKKEILINAGVKIDERQRLILTAGQLEQFLNFAFLSGTEKVGIKQNSGALSYQFQLGKDSFLRQLELNGYTAKTPSRDLTDKTFAIETATLYEL